MASVQASQAAIPVFVFLDEGIPPVGSEIFDSLTIDGKYKISVIQFPSLFKSLGIFDFQVFLWIKKMILSDQYHIQKLLSQEPLPRFILLTSDKNFIEDVERGMKMQAKFRKQKNSAKKIIFNSHAIKFFVKEHLNRSFFLLIGHIPQGKSKQGILIQTMTRTVADILHSGSV